MAAKANRNMIILMAIILIAGSVFIWMQTTRVRLNNPESVVYDAASKSFLISNAGGASIVSMDSAGKLHKFFHTGLSKPRGMKLVDKNLYVTDDTRVHIIDISTRKITRTFPIGGAKMLNDVETDDAGNIYVTDTRADALYIIDPATGKAEKFTSPQMKAPNGIHFDRPRKQMFIVCLTKHSPILSFNIVNREFSIFKETMYSDLDGIVSDELGRIFFTSWNEKAIYMIPQEQNRFILFAKDIDSPADIIWHAPGNELIVPVFQKNRLQRIPLD